MLGTECTFELLVSRGHKLHELLTVYPLSTVAELAKAAHINRIYDAMASANQVAVGAVHAIEAGFSGKTPKVLHKYMENMKRAARKAKTAGRKDVKEDTNALLGAFGGVPKEIQKRVRHQDNPRSRK